MNLCRSAARLLRRSIPLHALLILGISACHKREVVHPPVPARPQSDQGFVTPPPFPPHPQFPNAGPAAKQYEWLGPPVAFGTWVTIPSLWLVTGWRAKPGTKIHVQIDWPGRQTPHLCVNAGNLAPEEEDLDEAHATVESCPKPNAAGLSDATIQVPANGNLVWLSLHSEGLGPPTMRLKVEVL